jgi:NAD(P)-dependent dehydrogenase (short-subunit alcohol dehydrogenase family)
METEKAETKTKMPNSNRVALITGGTTGIGLAAARVLHQQGFAVIVTGVNPDTMAAAKRNLPQDVVVLRADLRLLSDAERVAAEAKQHFGKLDVVFLNAGVGRMLPLEAVDQSTYDDLFDINVKGQYFTLQKVLPLLTTGSSVIFTSSLIANQGNPNFSVYAATKGALLSLVRSLAVELAPRRIRVNAIVPGAIDTPFTSKVGVPSKMLDGVRRTIIARVPLGRVGTDEEVAGLVAFLASSSASYVTGATIAIDGGLGAA